MLLNWSHISDYSDRKSVYNGNFKTPGSLYKPQAARGSLALMFILLLSLHSETLCLFKKKKEKEREMFVVLCICNWLYKIIINYWTLVICLFEGKGRPSSNSSPVGIEKCWRVESYDHGRRAHSTTSSFSAQRACACNKRVTQSFTLGRKTWGAVWSSENIETVVVV